MRAAAVLAFADALAEHGEELARLDSLDNGSPLHEMRNDIGLATSQIRYLAGLAPEVRGRTMPETPAGSTTRCVSRSAWSPGSSRSITR